MRQAQRAIRARFHKLITPYNLTVAQFKVLQHLHWHDKEGGLGICELSEHIGLANSTTSGIVDRLERDGWVVREQSELDHRKVRVRLREKGRELFKRIPEEVEEFWRTTIGRLSAKDQVELVNSLRKLREVMEQPTGPSYEEIHEGQRRGLEAEIRAGTRRNLEEVFSDTLKEIGSLLVLARKAEEEGHFESTAYLKQMAAEQVECAFLMAKMLGYVDDVDVRVKELIEAKGTSAAIKEKAMDAAQEEGCDQVAIFFEHIVEVERKHRRALERILESRG
ncbi:MAG: hypothetical protein DRP95_06455 [Candidatus Latescibacterota bacterium]|nr:MAG: hypothetical protein DRP95_06455 [Candidatus Latescibacterota bacterium]